jgi:hypothetical protein
MTTVNLMNENGQEGLEADLKSKVKDIDTVSHVYFFGMVKHSTQGRLCANQLQHTSWIQTLRYRTNIHTTYVISNVTQKEIDTNVLLLDRAVKAIENLSKKLQFVVLPTGTKVIRQISSVSCVVAYYCRHMAFTSLRNFRSLTTRQWRRVFHEYLSRMHLKCSITISWTI